mgnify:CR=1 FL=1
MRGEIIERATNNYINSLKGVSPLPPVDKIRQDLFDVIRAEIKLENDGTSKDMRYKQIQDLPELAIAKIMLFIYQIRNIRMTENSKPALAMYDEAQGIYRLNSYDDGFLRSRIRIFSPNIRLAEVNEIITILSDKAPVVDLCQDQDLIFLNNGIFNYKTKTLSDFTPDIIAIAKSGINYNPNATNVIKQCPDGTTWDVESWMSELSTSPDVVNLLWQIAGAILRNLVRWDKAVFFYNTNGCNGKGTFAELLKQLCGGHYATMSMREFGTDFGLTPLIGAIACICDENEVNAFQTVNAQFKAAVTGDNLSINIKNKAPISYKFNGLIVQCFNSLPQMSDRTASMYRRHLFVPFDSTFLGKERKYIKTEYMHDTEVLEYVVYKVLTLMPDYYEFDNPEECKNLMEIVKENNSPVRQFVSEFFNPCQFAWDLLPYPFLYDLFKEWFRRNSPSGKLLSKNTFVLELKQIIAADYADEWVVLTKRQRSSGRMNKPEHLIYQYNLTNWGNAYFFSSISRGNIDPYCTPRASELAEKYDGLFRVAATNNTTEPEE